MLSLITNSFLSFVLSESLFFFIGNGSYRETQKRKILAVYMSVFGIGIKAIKNVDII